MVDFDEYRRPSDPMCGMTHTIMQLFIRRQPSKQNDNPIHHAFSPLSRLVGNAKPTKHADTSCGSTPGVACSHGLIGRYDFGLFLNFITGKQGLLCVTETWRYGYIRDYGDRVETPHGTTIGCEKSSNGLKKRFILLLPNLLR